MRFLASIIAFPLFWTLETWMVGRLSGAAGAAVFALTLPLSGLVAYRYLAGTARLRSRFRLGVLALTRERAARLLVAERGAIIAELEHARVDYLHHDRSQLLSVHPPPEPEIARHMERILWRRVPAVATWRCPRRVFSVQRHARMCSDWTSATTSN